MSLFLDIHALQTLPPSNVNRDDSGAPKNATFGGVLRSRVSSQSWKKAIRDYFREQANSNEASGVRTRWVIKEMVKDILALDSEKTEEEAFEIAKNTLLKIGIKTNSKKGREDELDVIFFLSRKQIHAMAQISLDDTIEEKDLKKRLKEVANNDHAYDMALFGRMVAVDPGFNIEAASQFAHAIGIDALTPEFDFWAATDDIGSEEHSGSGNLGVFEFNSSTYYRFASVDLNTLNENLGTLESVQEALDIFLKGYFNAVPKGKENSFAAPTLPGALVVTLRENAPVSYANAFEKPITRTRNETVLENGFTAMLEYADNLEKNYGTVGMKTWIITVLDNDNKIDLPTAINEIKQEVSQAYSVNADTE